MGGEDHRTDKRNDGDGAVIPLGLPGMDETGNVHQADDGHHDDGGQYGLGQMIEQGRKKQKRNQYRHAGEDAGQARHRPGLQVDRRTGEGPGSRVAFTDGPQHIAQSLADQFLVGVQALTGLAGHGLGDRDRLHEAQKGDNRRKRQQVQHDPDVDGRNRHGRQPLGNGADHGATAHHLELGGHQGLVADLDAPGSAIALHAGRDGILGIELQGAVGLGHAGQQGRPDFFAEAMGVGLQAGDVHIGHVDVVGGIQDTDRVMALFGRAQGLTDAGPFLGQGRYRRGGGVELLDELANLGRFDGVDAGGLIVLETHRPGDGRGDDHGHENVGDPRRQPLESIHDAEGEDAHEKGRPVGVMDGPLDHIDDGLVMMRGGIHIDTEHLGQLGGSDDDGGGVGEAVDHRMREKIDHQSQSQDPQAELKYADHQGQQNGVGDVPRAAGGGQGSQRGGCHQRNHRHRSGGQLAARSKERGDHGWQKGGVESVIRRQPRKLGIGHGLRNQNQGHGQP
ncbi:hypothetical protein DESC_880015 [Desulfosarcina cetonica]|nr:hypothetical protein DESC_880015 [Desulfosarcina cetonica]